ncbi:Aryl-alcohol dehydrogenase related enzyme [Halapricum desulfuricans]|uniref:Aryl-alcohol dehydrogenase related enzyme n=2 Tax=Halapricum desulfuricans TaxID=2841257 RepID=A0A897NCE9_9EURY|nr:Aryl-alcohol dehydrogenase related enzyme [Halapricum desulfuricans]
MIMDSDVVPYTTLGSTGLEVSRLALGCMNFGSEAEWMIDDRERSFEIIDRAIDLGINVLDTANVYSTGESEEIVGEAIASHRRDELVIATKVFGEMHDGPNGQGLSRKHIIDQAHASLDRLGVDYIDLYQIHRWDENTPIEETLSALTHLVDEGIVRYIGASTMAGWQFSKALYTADIEGYERFVSMQPEYNAVDRHEEANLLPICAEEDIGVIPWSPLAGGFLTGKYERDADPDEDLRAATDEYTRNRFTEENWDVLEEIRAIAEERDATPAQVSLAWLLEQDVVTAPIIGPRRIDHLEENVAAVDLELTDEEVRRIAEPKFPQWPQPEKDR